MLSQRGLSLPRKARSSRKSAGLAIAIKGIFTNTIVLYRLATVLQESTPNIFQIYRPRPGIRYEVSCQYSYISFDVSLQAVFTAALSDLYQRSRSKQKINRGTARIPTINTVFSCTTTIGVLPLGPFPSITVMWTAYGGQYQEPSHL